MGKKALKAAEAVKPPRIALVAPPRSARAPGHLSLTMRRWWNRVNADFELEDHDRLRLTKAGEFWDREVAARMEIERSGMIYQDRFGAPHPHPLLAVEHAARIGFLRAVRELGLDITVPGEPRAPGITGRRT
jgi:phage terminase small subunit